MRLFYRHARQPVNPRRRLRFPTGAAAAAGAGDDRCRTAGDDGPRIAHRRHLAADRVRRPDRVAGLRGERLVGEPDAQPAGEHAPDLLAVHGMN